MNKKTLIIIIAILAVILIAGIVLVFVLPNSQSGNPQGNTVAPNAGDPSTVETNGNGEPVNENPDGPEQTPTEDEQAAPGANGPAQSGDAADSSEEPEGPLFPDVPNVELPEIDEIGYMDYHNMSATEQKAFINTFESYDAFFDWLDAAKEKYEKEMVEIDGSTPVNAGDLVGGN